MASPFSNFTPTLDDHDYMELVWENGQILTKGRSGRTQTLGSNGYNCDSPQNRHSKSLWDLYEAAYEEIFKQDTSDTFNKNLGDTQIVPVRENTGSNDPSPLQHTRVLPEGSDNMREKLNFSVFVKPVGSTLIETANGSSVVADHKNEQNLKPVEDSVPDEQSAAVGRSSEMVSRLLADKEKGNCNDERSSELQVPSSSMCSRGASNYPSYSLTEKHEETEGSASLSNDSEEEPEDEMGQVPARTRNPAKRKRAAEVHNLSERKRRDKINEKMRALQELLPNCNKVDKASMLDEAIEYLKTLQLQIQMMSMRNGFVAPAMMLPLAHYSPMGLGMGMGMHMGVQFLPSPVSGAASVARINDAGHMQGFPARPGLMPMSCSSFFSSLEGSSTHSFPPPTVPVATFPWQLQKSASLEDPIRKSNPEMVNNVTFEHLQMPNFSQVEKKNSKPFTGQARR